MNEIFEWIVAGETPEIIQERFREQILNDHAFSDLLTIAFHSKCGIVGIPEGIPDLDIKIERDIPDGIANSTIRQEMRRIVMFQSDGKAQLLKQKQREGLWMRILEAVHYKEADLLTWIKDHTVLDHYPDLLPSLRVVGLAPQDPAKGNNAL